MVPLSPRVPTDPARNGFARRPACTCYRMGMGGGFTKICRPRQDYYRQEVKKSLPVWRKHVARKAGRDTVGARRRAPPNSALICRVYNIIGRISCGRGFLPQSPNEMMTLVLYQCMRGSKEERKIFLKEAYILFSIFTCFYIIGYDFCCFYIRCLYKICI